MMPRPMQAVRLVLLALLALAPATAPAGAGPITPPPGPVASTGATMILALPYTISEPGTYYLGRNLTATAESPEGITVTASGVTLDLNGFSLSGPGLSGSTAITVTGNSFTVRNGTIRQWFYSIKGSPHQSQASDLLVYDVAPWKTAGAPPGVDLGGQSAVTECVIVGAGKGIFTGDDSRIGDCVVIGCDSHGIVTGSSSTISGCVVRDNGHSHEHYQVRTGPASFVRHCSIHGHGLTLTSAIQVGAGSTIEGCSIRRGVIIAGSGCIVDSCTVDTSGGPFWISLFGDSVVTGCTIAAPGSDGIIVSGTGNLVEGNRITTGESGYGITVSSSGNLVIRNKVSGNPDTAYFIAPGNAYGQIINVTGNGEISGADT